MYANSDNLLANVNTISVFTSKTRQFFNYLRIFWGNTPLKSQYIVILPRFHIPHRLFSFEITTNCDFACICPPKTLYLQENHNKP